MFTGIIENVGRVVALRGDELAVELGFVADTARAGDSICVSGVCLTVTKLEGQRGFFDVSGETVRRSATGSLKAGQEVNLERALQAGGRLDGHIVQGHIDGTGKVSRVQQSGQFAEVTVEAGAELLEQMVEKGSVAVDGISLTIAKLYERSFMLALIPETLARTNWKDIRAGRVVNIETDIVGKMIKKQVEKYLSGGKGLSREALERFGFA